MYKRILVPLDGSKTAECALTHVINLVRSGAAGEVTLLSVISVHIPGRGDIPGVIDMKMLRENLLTESKRYLADVESRLASEGINVKKESVEGSRPAETISDYANNNGIDMIVIATHGYTGLKKLMFGSVAFGVLHEAHVPVMLIRPEACW